MNGEATTEFAKTLRIKREGRGMSIRAAARGAGFSEGRWRQLERGENPTAATVLRAARALDMSPVEMFAIAGIDADVKSVESQIMAEQEKEARNLSTRELTDRMSDLGLTDLRRLRDMVDAAIAVLEH